MALLALEDGSPENALHHIDHLIELVTGPHQAQMMDIKAFVEEGNPHEAIHSIQNMLTGTETDGITRSGIKARLARSSAPMGDVEGAIHHLGHLLEVSNDTPGLAGQVVEIRESVVSARL